MTDKTWDNWNAIIVWLFMMVATIVLALLQESVHPVFALLLNLGLLGYALHAAKRLGLLGSFEVFKRWQTYVWLLGGLLAIYVIDALGVFLLVQQYGDYVAPKNQQGLIESQMPHYLLFFDVVCSAPIVEEILMRGILMGRLFRRYSLIGLLLSTFLFGLMHGPSDLGSWVIYGGMGLVQGLLYWKTRRLEMNIALHALQNAIGFLHLIGVL